MTDPWAIPTTSPAARRAAACRPAALCGAMMLLAGGLSSGCALTNISADSCESDDQCREAFGLGSSCQDGYCSTPPSCLTGHDCRALAGGGACVEHVCRDLLPTHPQCPTAEPADLFARRLTGPNAPLIVGSILGMGDAFDAAQSGAIRLGAREINDVSGLSEGQPLGVVVCDSGGPDDSAQGEERQQLNRAALDYLGGVLGVPFLVGPTRSDDAFTVVSHTVAQSYPTVIISPAATNPQLVSEPDKLSPDDPFGLFWRTCPNDELQGRVLANNVIGQLPDLIVISSVAIVYNDDPYGDGLANVFQTEWDGPGRTSQRYPFDSSTDRQALAGELAAANPDGVLIIAVTGSDAVGILSAIAESPMLALELKRFYLTDASKDSVALFEPGLSAEVQLIITNQTVGTAPASPVSAEFSSFAAALAKDFGVSGTDFAFLANSYDAAYVGAYGVLWAQSGGGPFDGRQVAEGLARLSAGSLVHTGKNDWSTAKSGLLSGGEINIEGISGPLDFNPVTGEAPGPIEVWQPQPGGGFATILTVTP